MSKGKSYNVIVRVFRKTKYDSRSWDNTTYWKNTRYRWSHECWSQTPLSRCRSNRSLNAANILFLYMYLLQGKTLGRRTKDLDGVTSATCLRLDRCASFKTATLTIQSSSIPSHFASIHNDSWCYSSSTTEEALLMAPQMDTPTTMKMLIPRSTATNNLYCFSKLSHHNIESKCFLIQLCLLVNQVVIVYYSNAPIPPHSRLCYLFTCPWFTGSILNIINVSKIKTFYSETCSACSETCNNF